MAVWRVYLRDQSGAILDELDSWTALDCRRVRNGVGTWMLEISTTNNVNARYLDQTRGILLTRNDVVVFSGQIFTEFTRTATTLRCGGLCDNYLLLRPALPDPLGPPFTTAFDTVTGRVSDVMQRLVWNNTSAPYARADRVVANLLLPTPPALGATGFTGRAGGEPLLTVLQNIAASPQAGGLGFGILQASPQSVNRTFTIFQSTDRSGSVKFGVELGTASDFVDTRAAPQANAWYVMGGDGLGLDKRTTVYDSHDSSVADWGLIEQFYDARGITDTGELNVKLAELLAGVGTSHKTTITPLETDSQQFVTHWNLGDLVTVQVVTGPASTETTVDLIREVRITFDQARGWLVTPLIGADGATDDSLTARHIASVQDRLSNIERNFDVPDASIIRAMLTDLLKPPIGHVVPFAGTTPPAGWLLCNGSAISRTTYALLFATIGVTYGAGNGTTTFNLPDTQGRVILGVSGTHALGSTGGSETAAGLAHTHPGSHSHGHAHTHSHAHTGALHTHPGSHSHGMSNHNHLVDIDHNHPNQASAAGASAEAPNSINHGTTLTVTPTNPAGHTHPVDIAALGSTPIGSGNQSSGGNSTQADSNVFAASFSGNTGTDASAASTGTTDPDSNAPAASYSGAINTLPPFIAMNHIVYCGV